MNWEKKLSVRLEPYPAACAIKLKVEHPKEVCEQLTSEVAPSPSCLLQGVGGMKAEPETSIITIIYLLKHTNQLQLVLKVNVKGVAERKQ
ncbi:hypothetical protein TNCV_1043901 [Trichonephila clavipes]|nr:hypothetical protein TNCV_1043901 [Trichonephila clavipes]